MCNRLDKCQLLNFGGKEIACFAVSTVVQIQLCHGRILQSTNIHLSCKWMLQWSEGQQIQHFVGKSVATIVGNLLNMARQNLSVSSAVAFAPENPALFALQSGESRCE